MDLVKNPKRIDSDQSLNESPWTLCYTNVFRMAQILTIYSYSEFKELLSNEVRSAVREVLSYESREKQTQQDHSGIGYRTRPETRKLLGIAYSTMHYWEKAGILVPNRIGRKVFFSDEPIREAPSRLRKELYLIQN